MTSMMTVGLLALGAIVMMLLVGRWVFVTRRDIEAARDRALQSHLDWRTRRQRSVRSASALRL